MNKNTYSFGRLLTPLLCAMSLIMAYTIVNPLNEAWAVSFISVSNTTDATGITRSTSGKVWVGSVTGDTVKIYQQSSQALILSISSITNPFQMATKGDRVYAFGSSLYEFDATTNSLLRTTAHGCDVSGNYEKAYFDTDAGFVYCITSGNLIKKINLDTMATDATSTTINTGANACPSSQDLSYESSIDTMFVTCSTGGTDYFVAIVAPFTSGTPDFRATQDNNLEIASGDGKVLVCGTSTDLQWYTFSTGTGFSSGTSLSASNCGTSNSHQHLIFHEDSSRFVYVSNEDGRVMFFDSDDLAVLYSNIPYGGTSPYQVYAYSNTFYYFGNLEASKWQEMDSTGIALGEGSGGFTPQSECPVDVNFDGVPDRIYFDIGGPDGVPDSAGNGGVPDGICDAGSLPLQGQPLNQTAGNIGCVIGIISCTNGVPDNPDLASNGLGYLLVIILMAIMIAFFALAQAKTGLDIPDWLFIIGVFAVLGASVSFGWIDSTLFIIGAVVVAGMTATKFIQKFAGSSFR